LLLKKPSCLLVPALVIFNGLGLALALISGRFPFSLFLRNAIFSDLVDNQQLPSEAALNALLKRRIRQDPPELGSAFLFTSPELVKLDYWVVTSRRGACRVHKDPAAIRLNPTDCLARALAKDVSPYMVLAAAVSMPRCGPCWAWHRGE